MLLTRSLPPQFLLPAWSSQQLAAVQRAYNSTDNKEHYPEQRSKGAILREAAKPHQTSTSTEKEGYQGGITIRRLIGRPARYKPWLQVKPAGGESGEGKTQANEDQLEEPPSRPPLGILQSWPPIVLPAEPVSPPVQKKKRKAEEKETPKPRPDNVKPQKSKKTEALSLFDELFPEERHTKSPEQRMAEYRLDKLPAFNWTPEINIGDRVEEEEKQSLYNQIPRRDPFNPATLSTKYTAVSNVRRLQETLGKNMIEEERGSKTEKGVLVLNACSKTLEESDFFRISPKGQHIEGWKSGLLKVIPTRDNKTLEALGSYFLIFSSPAAARAYLDQTMRLHTLTRLHKKDKEARFPLPPGYLKEGENLENLIKGFSLIPGFVKLSLRMLSRPFSPRVEKLIQEGGPAAIAGREAGAEHMVLFTTDRSHITHADVGGLLRQDGKRRNMHWNIASNIRESIIRVQTNEREQLEEPSTEARRFGKGARTYSGPERFIISFKDSHEARRFVREWHCRPLPMHQVRRAEDEPPPIVNAEILW